MNYLEPHAKRRAGKNRTKPREMPPSLLLRLERMAAYHDRKRPAQKKPLQDLVKYSKVEQ